MGKDAFGTIISKAKGFIREMFEKYGLKPVQYVQTPDGVKIPIVQEIKGEATEAVTKKVIKVSNISKFFKIEFGKK